jgi:uncharacterized protein YndB with AHSA1/START domain
VQEQSSSDRIEKEVRLPTPRSRVWRALTDPKQFGEWFGVKFNGPFTAGATTIGNLTNKAYEHVNLEFAVVAIEPERRFSFRWHPYALDANMDYSKEPMTLVEFTLEESDGGTLLKVVESGFDKIPASRRTKAFEMNTGGWTSQMTRIAKYVEANP